MLGNDYILVIGGSNGNIPIKLIEIYDIKQNEFFSNTRYPFRLRIGRIAPCVSLYQNYGIYILGGLTKNQTGAWNISQTWEWLPVSSYQTARLCTYFLFHKKK